MTFRFGRLAGLGLVLVALAANIAAATYTAGDVFASKSGSVREYSPTGTFVQALTSGIVGFTTGSAFFTTNGDFYVTDFSNNTVLKFADNATNTQTTFASGFATPEDILVDGSGKVFVSDLGGNFKTFNSAGTQLSSVNIGHRIDWFDLNSSESLMYYT